MAVPIGRKKGTAQVSRGKIRPEASSSSSQCRRRLVAVAVADDHDALWRRAFNPDTLVLLAQYADSSAFEDASDRKKTAREKYAWWGQYLAERKSRRMAVTEVLEARLERYHKTMASTELRRTQGCRRRDARAIAREAVVDLVSDRSEVKEGDRACSSANSIGRIEESQQRKRRGMSSDGAASESRGKKVRKEADSNAAEERAMGSDDEVDLVHARGDPAESARALALELEEVLVGMREALSEDIIRVRGLIDSLSPKRRKKPRGKR